ncbi:Na+/H+ antiporter subunit E [Pseudaminobacter arsenicus]|uniref:Na+/H+ antiporter subunit E n=1 Tax=Borborobacter arsenicus TaxID=1851146 RepID=A0A432VAR4_9HYPH|nr:Na+/H+ antiporter subunit E [Pseudaminobacter arsenicus]RUM99287.1 Na+/H+ antiporter subunit E [Pseudaminobacter arsenicus]
MSRLLPYPLLTVSLVVMWLLLNSFSLGHAILGTAIALFASRAMVALQPSKPRLRRWDLIPKLIYLVFIDILRSNIAVTSIILKGGHKRQTSGFVMIPLELRDRTGLAILACIITSTPGTAWVDYNAANGRLLTHVLDLVDEQGWINVIKRYEHLLMEIFE